MSLIVIDFESYWDQDYSLSKITTEDYLRSPLFEVIGVSVKVDDGPIQWFSGTHAETHFWLSQFDMQNHAVAAHNAMFDMGILSWKFGIRPKLILDTLSMARALDGLATGCSLAKLAEYYQCSTPKGNEVHNTKGMRRADFTPAHLAQYGVYCRTDVQLCYEILQKNLHRLPKSKVRLIDWTIRAFTEPKLWLNQLMLAKELRDFHARSHSLLTSAGVTDPGDLRSDEKFASLLINAGVVPPMKDSPSGVREDDGTIAQVYAFAKSDLAFTDLLEDEDEKVVALVEARLGHKTSQVRTRIERFQGIAARGPLPVPISYAGATTTKRWSGCDKINMQNLPRNPKGGKSPLRDAIMAPKGWRLAAPDLSQIELRANCWQSGQEDTLDILRTGGDVYSVMASTLFGQTITKAMGKSTHTAERFVGKTTELGCGYQCGAEKFHRMLLVDSRKYGIPLPDRSAEFAQMVVNTYRRTKPFIKQFWQSAEDILPILAGGGTSMLGPYTVSDKKIWLPDGSYLYYPNLRREPDAKSRRGWAWKYDRIRGRSAVPTYIYGGKLVENVTQAVSALFMGDALLRMIDLRDGAGGQIFFPVFTVHDEIPTLYPETSDEKWVIEALTWCMTKTPDWAPTIPLDCEVNTGLTYAECK